ncbi:MAG: pilus assembly protein [Syntrophomonadaceae bacterium]|jgi:hypothetical protein|nr:pilus assembly protein [Syntrophomonadaceae bacterium]
MLKGLKQLFRDESGAAIVIVTIALLVIIGCMALVIDVGVVYAERIQASNAVDAAVLAGVGELPLNPGNALAIAQNYALANGLSSEQVVFQIQDSGKSIRGIVDYDQPMYFARVFNIYSAKVKPTAKARVGPAGQLGAGMGVVPIAVEQDEIVFDKPMTLKEGGGSGEQGWYGCLDLVSLTKPSGGGASEYEHYLTYGYDGSGTVKRDTLILEENGNMSGPTRRAIEYRIAKCKAECDRECTAADHDPDCPLLVIVPVGKMINNKYFQVESFAAFYLSPTIGNGNNSVITGQYVRPVTVPGAKIDDSIADNGVYTRVLVE